jgi:hypothetical protein
VKQDFLSDHRQQPGFRGSPALQGGKAVPLLLLVLVLAGLTLKYNEVDDALTREDIAALASLLGPAANWPTEKPRLGDWPTQLAQIKKIVSQVYDATPSNAAIPNGLPREPKDVLQNKGGVCYDRSRLIEKALASQQFKVRHVALYRQDRHSSKLASLFVPQVKSHAVSEVRTERGWMLIDSLDGWIALDARANPLSAQQLATNADSNFSHLQAASTPEFYKQSFLYVYGLYSRHGNFYPPFTPIPDLNYRQFLDNFR